MAASSGIKSGAGGGEKEDPAFRKAAFKPGTASCKLLNVEI